MILLMSDAESKRHLQQLKHAMDAGVLGVYEPPKKPEYGFWTNIAYDVASIPSEFIKGAVEGEVDLATSIPTSLGYYTPDNKIDIKPWYNVAEDAGVMGGVAHNIGHFLSAFGTSFIASFSTPFTAVAAPIIGLAGASVASGTRSYKELRDAGVAHETAKTGASMSSIATFVGGKVAGVYGKSLVSKALTGGATNIAFEQAERQAIGGYLESQGYQDLAEHYKRLDGTSLVASFVIGAGLGALHGKGGSHPDIKSSDIDIAQAVKSDIHNMVDASSGVAVTGQSAEIHARTLDQAIEQMRRGEEVTVDLQQMELMTKGMIAKPDLELDPELRKLLKQGEEAFIPEQKKVKTRFDVDPLSSRVPEYERKLLELEQTFAHDPVIKERITRDIDLSKKDIFNAALHCLLGVH